jgi:hypothetical protein
VRGTASAHQAGPRAPADRAAGPGIREVVGVRRQIKALLCWASLHDWRRDSVRMRDDVELRVRDWRHGYRCRRCGLWASQPGVDE